MAEDVAAFGFGIEEVLILLGGEPKVAINFAAPEAQVQCLLFGVICRRGEQFRFKEPPDHIRPLSSLRTAGGRPGCGCESAALQNLPVRTTGENRGYIFAGGQPEPTAT